MCAEDPEPQPCSGTSPPPTPPRARSPNPIAHLTPTKSGVSTGAAHVSVSTQAIDRSPRARPTQVAGDQDSSSEEESTRSRSASVTEGKRLRGRGRNADQLVQVEGVTGNVSPVSADARSELRQQLLREQSWRSSPGRSRASSAVISAKGVYRIWRVQRKLTCRCVRASSSGRTTLYATTVLCAHECGQACLCFVSFAYTASSNARNHGEDEDSLTSMMGVAQALISIFQAEDDKPRMIVHGDSRIVFNIKDHLYFFAVSDWGEPEYIVSRLH